MHSNKHYTTSIQRLLAAQRFDVDYFRPEFTELDDMLDTLTNVKSLGKLADVKYGFMPTEDYATPETGIPLIRVTNILPNGTIDMSDVKYVRSTSSGLQDKLVEEKDILMVQCGNTTGKVALVPRELTGHAYASFCFRIRPISNEVTAEYLCAVLQSSIGFRQVWRSITYATVRPNTTKPYTEAIKIPVPPPAIQNRIARVMQEAYATRGTKLAEAESSAQEIERYVLAMLGINLANIESKRVAIKPISALAGRRFDFGAVVTLSEVNHGLSDAVVLGDVVQPVMERITPKDACPDDDISYVGLGNIKSNTGELVNFALSKGNEILSSSPTFKKGDILFGRMRPYLNKVWIAEFDGVCSGEVVVLRPNAEKVDTHFLQALIQSRITLDQVIPLQSGSSLPRVSASDILSVRLPVPQSLQTQTQIGEGIRQRKAEARRLWIEADAVVAEAKALVERVILGKEAV